ncbi:MAG: hypothetical protein KDK70_05660 [Myxococcales bacterium]|nr:hypothetical protein [Myxococcales bacterium]
MHLRRWVAAVTLAGGCHGGGGASPPGTGGSTDGSSASEAGDDAATADTTGAGTSTGAGSGDETSADGTTGEPEEHHFDLPALQEVNDGNFATSPVCAQCHSNAPAAQAMRDEAGHEIGPDDLWQGTMMANSARDPFWWAMVRAETVTFPDHAAQIEAECTQCHAPMAAIRDDLFGGPLALDDLLDGRTDRAQFGLDGVACAACHQVPAGQGLGPPALPATGEMFGPHAAPFTMPMQMHTGFVPVASSHMDESAMCGTCHTLDTSPLSAGGEPLGGHFPEQSPYLEWLDSDFSTESTPPGAQAASCQQCHMPSLSEAGVPISTRIARRPPGDDFPPIDERSPYHRHVLVGGNTVVPAMLRDFADELRPRAPSAAFDATIAAARSMLQHDTATLTLDGAGRQGDELVIPVRVENRAGHKFPTGMPARRAVLRVTVRDAEGALVFRSGGTNGAGQLVDDQGALLPLEQLGGAPQPHHQVITQSSQVQIYQSVMADEDGAPTYRLLRASSYAKDNRLLPAGWSPAAPNAAQTAPVLGVADGDFVGGSDTVEYRVLAPAGAGPYDVEVELGYQAIDPRFAAELLALEAPEIRAFARMWEAAEREPEPVVSAALVLP